MGDRCWIRLTIHGHIDNLVVFEEVLEALDKEGLYSDEGHDDMAREFAHALAFETNPQFQEDECNYANIDDAEAVLREYGIVYHVEHGAGDDYGASAWSWTKEHGKHATLLTHDGDAIVDVASLEEALKDEEPIEELKRIIAARKKACGEGLPQFSVGEVVKRHLATLLAVETLSPETV